MGLCIFSFVGIFAFVAGIALMLIEPPLMEVTVWGMIPVPMLIMTVGFIVALITLLFIRSLGDTFSEKDDTVRSAFRVSTRFAFISAVAMCAIQLYLRFYIGDYSFFVGKGGLFDHISVFYLEDAPGVLLLINTMLSVFLGLPWYIVTYFGGDFSRYVTVTHTRLSDGSTYESGRSESYVSIAQFIIMGLLLTVPFVAFSASLAVYFIAAAYGVFLFGRGSKRALTISALVFGAAAIAMTLATLLSGI